MTYNHAEYMKSWREKRKAAGLPTGTPCHRFEHAKAEGK